MALRSNTWLKPMTSYILIVYSGFRLPSLEATPCGSPALYAISIRYKNYCNNLFQSHEGRIWPKEPDRFDGFEDS
jgi:hypothetical protein